MEDGPFEEEVEGVIEGMNTGSEPFSNLGECDFSKIRHREEVRFEEIQSCQFYQLF